MQSVAWRFYVARITASPVSFLFIVRAEIIVFSIAGVLTPAIVWADRRFPLGRQRWAAVISAHILAGTVFALTIKCLWDFAILPFYYTPWIANFSWVRFLRSVFAGFQTNFILYWVAVIGTTAIDHARRLHQTATEAAELRAQLAEA